MSYDRSNLDSYIESHFHQNNYRSEKVAQRKSHSVLGRESMARKSLGKHDILEPPGPDRKSLLAASKVNSNKASLSMERKQSKHA